jgi:sec-independent protein translocase protein TatA
MFASLFGPDGIIVLVAVVGLLMFGGKKLPELARGLGSASHEFKKGVDEGDRDARATVVTTSETTPAEMALGIAPTVTQTELRHRDGS